MEHQEDGADGQQDGKHPFGPAQREGLFAGADLIEHLVKAGVDQDGVKDQVHDRVNHGQNLFTPDAHIVEDQGQRNHAAVSGS